jgi:hypothetical protein
MNDGDGRKIKEVLQERVARGEMHVRTAREVRGHLKERGRPDAQLVNVDGAFLHLPSSPPQILVQLPRLCAIRLRVPYASGARQAWEDLEVQMYIVRAWSASARLAVTHA